LDLVGASRERDGSELSAGLEALLRELREVLTAAAALPSSELGVAASSETFELGARFCAVLAASACVGVWTDAVETGSPFLQEPAWLIAALKRSGERAPRTPARKELRATLYREMMSRFRDGRAFDLVERRL
jgi:hypothetical protein